MSTYRNRRKDRPRIIGSVRERLLLHYIAQEVLDSLPKLHPELNIDSEALDHVRLGFLREPCRNLLGYCSYANRQKGRPRTEYEFRHGVHRILLNRVSMNTDLADAVFTIHHEFLHAILGSAEGHGETFRKHEARMEGIDRRIAERIREKIGWWR
ncbi:MAG: hypothetical protein VYB50_04240 [Candidatus Thermoplasmatota archaeon]|nr:hypothetical protein [Candidatus Thermoplasmatota archaeon]